MSDSIYTDGINPWSALPEGQRPNPETEAADLAEAIGMATGSRASSVTVEQVTYDQYGGRHVVELAEYAWAAMQDEDRREVNARVADVFEQAQEARLRQRMIKAWPALRDALTLT